MTRTWATIITVTVLSGFVGCGGEMDGWGEGQPGTELNSADFSNKVVGIAHAMIVSSRPKATEMMVAKLNLELANNAIVDITVPSLEDQILKPIGDTAAAQSCPYIDQNAGNSGFSCRYLVDRAQESALTGSGTLKDTIEQDVDRDYGGELNLEETQFVKGWVAESVLSGIDAGSVHALVRLRNTKVCDQALTPQQSAYKLGSKQGHALLEKTEKEVLPGVPRTICNTDTVANTVLAAAKKRVDTYVLDNPVCAGFQPADLAVAVDLAQAEQEREKGLKAGIQQAYEALRVRLVNTWQCIQPAPPTGDPLVVDLDHNGVQLSQRTARFDLAATGEPVRMPRLTGEDALLALDLDHSGVIESGAELFGNAAQCGSARCTDGVEALSQHDSNGDGVIDRRDPVFARLQLWQDRDGDGVSAPDELTSLAAAGIRSLGLEARHDLSFAGKRGSSLRALSFVRESGRPGVVFDMWFNVQLTKLPRDLRTMGIVSSLPTRRAASL